jgi:hypothetical protein
MQTNNEILNELQSISPVVAALEKVNLFTVPQGYFDSISATVLACLHEGQGIAGITKSGLTPGVPEGYFDQLSGSILNKIRAAETAADEIWALSPILAAIQNKNVFEVPPGYFENLDHTVIDKIKTATTQEELQNLSPLLLSLHHAKLFEVPTGYFTSLSDEILQKVQPQKAKVVSFWTRGAVIKYAAAAMLTGAMALGVYRYIDKPGEMVNEVVALDASVEKGKSMNDQQFNEGLQNLTDSDIAKYLENNGDIADVAGLRNNIDGGSLPSQDDYLLDGATLENYLKEIDKTTLNN